MTLETPFSICNFSDSVEVGAFYRHITFLLHSDGTSLSNALHRKLLPSFCCSPHSHSKPIIRNSYGCGCSISLTKSQAEIQSHGLALHVQQGFHLPLVPSPVSRHQLPIPFHLETGTVYFQVEDWARTSGTNNIFREILLHIFLHLPFCLMCICFSHLCLCGFRYKNPS